MPTPTIDPRAKIELPHNPFTIKAAEDGTAEVFIYGNIGDSWWGESVTAKDVADQLGEIEASTITVRINSYGGSVSDGLAIYNALRRHSATIDVVIDGVAVSIASLIAMAGDTVSMGENALFMVHAPWGGAVGNARDMRQFADLLDKFAGSMSSSYARKTGREKDEILPLLTDGEDHWYSAAEAKEFGFVDVVLDESEEDDDGDASAMAAEFLASRFGAAATRAAASLVDRFTQPGGTGRRQKPKEQTMPQPSNGPATAEPENKDDIQAREKAAREQALAAEKARKSAIRSAFSPFVGREGVQALLDECIDDHEVSAEAAQAKLLAQLGKDTTPVATDVRVTETSADKFKKGAMASLMAKAGLEHDDTANNFRSYSLLDLGRQCLAQHGVDTSRMDRMELVAAAFTHSSGDFRNLLANVANKAMLKGYEEAEETFQKWTTKGILTDFKPTKRVDLNSFPSLDEVPEGGEYKHGTVGDRGETITLATYGKLFSITRQAIINDDLMAFTRIPQKMGRAAIRTVGNLVYAILTSNPNMSDGKALFHADHNNLGTAGGITTASVEEMRKLMALQKDGGENAHALNIALAYLLVPVALRGTANVVANSEFEVGSSKNNTTPNTVRNTFEVIADARLDAASSTQWYGAASGSLHDTIEVAYLDGNEAPVLEQQSGWNVDGVEFKVRLDAAAKALDFRTLTRNAGQ